MSWLVGHTVRARVVQSGMWDQCGTVRHVGQARPIALHGFTQGRRHMLVLFFTLRSYLIGVTNPLFKERTEWWDVLFDLGSNTLMVNPSDASFKRSLAAMQKSVFSKVVTATVRETSTNDLSKTRARIAHHRLVLLMRGNPSDIFWSLPCIQVTGACLHTVPPLWWSMWAQAISDSVIRTACHQLTERADGLHALEARLGSAVAWLCYSRCRGRVDLETVTRPGCPAWDLQGRRHDHSAHTATDPTTPLVPPTEALAAGDSGHASGATASNAAVGGTAAAEAEGAKVESGATRDGRGLLVSALTRYHAAAVTRWYHEQLQIMTRQTDLLTAALLAANGSEAAHSHLWQSADPASCGARSAGIIDALYIIAARTLKPTIALDCLMARPDRIGVVDRCLDRVCDHGGRGKTDGLAVDEAARLTVALFGHGQSTWIRNQLCRVAAREESNSPHSLSAAMLAVEILATLLPDHAGGLSRLALGKTGFRHHCEACSRRAVTASV